MAGQGTMQATGSYLTDAHFVKGTAESVGMSHQRLEKLNARMHEYVNNGELAGVQTAIIRKGKLVHFNTYGYADVDENKELTDDAIWRIYSMTKPIVSVGLMMLHEEGRFQLNDPLEKYIPEFKDMLVYDQEKGLVKANRKIRIIDILRHTSGLGYGWGPKTYVDSIYNSLDKWGLKDTKGFSQWLGSVPLYYQPGEGWRYSVSTDVCGHLIEVISGQPLNEFLQERILEPLSMVDTHFEVPLDKKERFVTNYTHRNDKLNTIDHPDDSRYTRHVTHFSGGGGMLSTSRDYLRFCQMLLNEGILDGTRILSPKTIQLMTSDHTKGISHAGGPIVLPDSGTGFGLGFAVTTDLAGTAMTGSEGAFGWGGAAGTYFRVDPEEELIYLLMIQLMPYNHLQAREKFQTMVYQAIIE